MTDTTWQQRGGARPVVLVVDDEPDILEAVALQIQRECKVITADSGVEALRILGESGPIAAVISDQRMPGMDGIELLRRVQLEYPDTTRVLQTAQSDLNAAISAINDGGVFRYLSKPIPTDELRATVREAVARNEEAISERQVLDKTLKASIQALFDVLQLASPVAFARGARIRALVGELCQQLHLESHWEFEVAAMASQLGAVTIPPSVLQKLDKGLPCNEDEQIMVDAMPGVAVQLLRTIPMLGEVVEIVRALAVSNRDRSKKPASPVVNEALNVLRTAMDFDTLISRGLEVENAITVLECRENSSLHVLAALRKSKGIVATSDKVRGLKVVELETGMRVAEDIVAINGLVLIGRGMIVTELLLDRLTNYARMIEIIEPVLAVPGARN
jgi:response regulator RpfG family c-di-GMP phosphodiesterase